MCLSLAQIRYNFASVKLYLNGYPIHTRHIKSATLVVYGT